MYEHLRKQPARDTLLVDSGDVDAKLTRRRTVLKATYHHPYQMHASMGSSCAVADVQGDKATIWSATQSAYPTRNTSAMLLGLKPENVRVDLTRGAGCYGINGADTVSYDAALLSQAVGRPVRVQLSRKDEMAWENYGNAFVIDQRVALDGDGAIIVWDYEAWSPARGGRPGYNTPGNVVTGFLAGSSLRRSRRARRLRRRTGHSTTGRTRRRRTSPGASAIQRGGTGVVRSERVLSHRVLSPFFTGPLRAPERLQNTFAHECFMDEVAAHVKADPVAYRLRHLSHARLSAAIRAAAKAANWEHGHRRAEALRAPGRSPAAAWPASAMRATTATSRWSQTSPSSRTPAAIRSRDSSSRRTAGRSRIPTVCATRSKAARFRV